MTDRLIILGSTGSIGTQALDVARKLGIKITALTANSRVDLLEEQAREFNPRMVALLDEKAASDLRVRLADTDIKVLSGIGGICECAREESADTVLNSIVGMAGLVPTLDAIDEGKNLALANKETLVAGGQLVMDAARNKGVNIYPVDSEHSAIFQCLRGAPRERALKRIILTASGGPFFGKTREELADVTAAQALKHPNWTMGRKITIDSSTLVNKGLEVIEAKWLFDVDLDNIQVILQPQSIIHSAVQYVDGGIIAQLGTPDMKLPIQYALFYPDRRPMGGKRVDLFEVGSIVIEKPDMDTFKGLKFAYNAANAGGSMPTVFNAANEEAVALFLDDKIGFYDIYRLVSLAVETVPFIKEPNLEEILDADKQAREVVRTAYQNHK